MGADDEEEEENGGVTKSLGNEDEYRRKKEVFCVSPNGWKHLHNKGPVKLKQWIAQWE